MFCSRLEEEAWLRREKLAQEAFRRQQEKEEKAQREKEEREVGTHVCVHEGGGREGR